MMDKKVSVIMPAYNAEKFIEEAVRSVMAQTYENWELIIIDDCSKDRTAEIAEALSKEDKRIVFLRNENNMGVAKTRNRGLERASGDYAALLDSDDIWLSEKLEKQLEKLEATGAELSYCSYGMVDENGIKNRGDFIVPEEVDLEYSLSRMAISCSTAVFAKKIAENYRFENKYYHEDLVFWLSMLRDGIKTCGNTEVLAFYRVMDGTRASNKFKSAFHRWEIYRGFMKFSVLKSAVYFIKYAAKGFAKYKKL